MERASRVQVACECAGTGVGRQHFRRPVERPFTAAEREHVTILIGGLTWKHEKLIQAVLEGCGYRCQPLPNATLSSYHVGRSYGNPGQCNPTYFTVGSLIEYLRNLQAQGLTNEEIVDRYVFFTSGSCGPCRFGMYESEFRMALENAGFEGFRVLLFSQNSGIKAQSGQSGLKFTVDLGMGAMNAINLGDVTNEIVHHLRPYEVEPGESDRALEWVSKELATLLRDRPVFEILPWLPPWIAAPVGRRKLLKDTLNSLGKVREHLYGRSYAEALQRCRERLGQVEVDRLRVKPVVRITGEFWAQLTEGDGNFNMFAFLEREGAQVVVDSVGNWVMYLLHQARANAKLRKRLDSPFPNVRWWQIGKRLRNELRYQKKRIPFVLGERIWARQFHRVVERLGGIAGQLPSQDELARLAHPFYHSMARGGEGHLEVGKSVYYTVHHQCHMVLALKPFGCMPSSQSDGVQSAVGSRYPEMIFLPIETSGEGEINALSRVQMALTEARMKARQEFDRCLERSGVPLGEIRAYVDRHPELRSPLYHVPRQPGVAGVAANFVLHVAQRMKREGIPLLTQVRGEA